MGSRKGQSSSQCLEEEEEEEVSRSGYFLPGTTGI